MLYFLNFLNYIYSSDCFSYTVKFCECLAFFFINEFFPRNSKPLREYIFYNHRHKKRKDNLETRTVLLIFLLELEIPGVTIQGMNENTIFCSYDYGENAPDAVEKIATDEKYYHKCSLCVIVCCIVAAYHQ